MDNDAFRDSHISSRFKSESAISNASRVRSKIKDIHGGPADRHRGWSMLHDVPQHAGAENAAKAERNAGDADHLEIAIACVHASS